MALDMATAYSPLSWFGVFGNLPENLQSALLSACEDKETIGLIARVSETPPRNIFREEVKTFITDNRADPAKTMLALATVFASWEYLVPLRQATHWVTSDVISILDSALDLLSDDHLCLVLEPIFKRSPLPTRQHSRHLAELLEAIDRKRPGVVDAVFARGGPGVFPLFWELDRPHIQQWMSKHRAVVKQVFDECCSSPGFLALSNHLRYRISSELGVSTQSIPAESGLPTVDPPNQTLGDHAVLASPDENSLPTIEGQRRRLLFWVSADGEAHEVDLDNQAELLSAMLSRRDLLDHMLAMSAKEFETLRLWNTLGAERLVIIARGHRCEGKYLDLVLLRSGLLRHVLTMPDDEFESLDLWNTLGAEGLVTLARISPTFRRVYARRLMKRLKHNAPIIAYPNKPVLSIASECALLFSLPHLPLFLKLCWHVLSQYKQGKHTGHRCDDLYVSFDVEKRAGGIRHITNPSPLLKDVQQVLLEDLTTRLDDTWPDACHGFRRGKSIKTNAELHCGKAVIVHADIESFFDNTGYWRIWAVLTHVYGHLLSAKAIWFLVDVCCYNGGLPTGAPTSPILANAVLCDFDRLVAQCAEKKQITYSRYADDLTFSGRQGVQNILPFVKSTLQKVGYRLKEDKTYILRQHNRQRVTGLVVNGNTPSVHREFRRGFRAGVDRLTRGVVDAAPTSVRGRAAYLLMVNPKDRQGLEFNIVNGIRQILKDSGPVGVTVGGAMEGLLNSGWATRAVESGLPQTTLVAWIEKLFEKMIRFGAVVRIGDLLSRPA